MASFSQELRTNCFFLSSCLFCSNWSLSKLQLMRVSETQDCLEEVIQFHRPPESRFPTRKCYSFWGKPTYPREPRQHLSMLQSKRHTMGDLVFSHSWLLDTVEFFFYKWLSIHPKMYLMLEDSALWTKKRGDLDINCLLSTNLMFLV